MIQKWHSWLDMPKHDIDWHLDDLNGELAEYQEKQNILKKWSELGDVSYAYSRGVWSGHDIKYPFSKLHYYVGCIYMVPKLSGRYLFFKKAGQKAGAKRQLKEVRNPIKMHKLHHIAEKYDLDRDKFQKICEDQLKYWLLLP
ncbi:MAG: hypothetical protein WCQ49_03075 [Candidatus Saccharibacteria bacterium]